MIVACGVPYSVKLGSSGDEAIARIAEAGGDRIARIFASTVLAVEDPIKTLLDVPADDPLRVVMLIALGRPAEVPSPPPPPRHPVVEVARFYE